MVAFAPKSQVPVQPKPAPAATNAPRLIDFSGGSLFGGGGGGGGAYSSMTLDELMARQKALAASPNQPGPMPTPAHGAAYLVNQLGDVIQQHRLASAEEQQREELSQLMSLVDPQTGELSPEVALQIAQIDPEFGQRIYEGIVSDRRAREAARVANEQAIANREDIQAATAAENAATRTFTHEERVGEGGTQAFTTAERIAKEQADAKAAEAANAFTAEQNRLNRRADELRQQIEVASAAGRQDDAQAAAIELAKITAQLNETAAVNEDTRTTTENIRKEGVAADVAATAADVEAQKPGSGAAKIMADYNNGQFGAVGSPEALKLRDAALAKENALPASTVTINNPAASSMAKLYETLGKDVYPQFLKESAAAGDMNRNMELLTEVAKQAAVQGPLTGRLAQAFPGFDNSAALFQSIVLKLAPQQRAEGSGSTSDIEYKGMLASMPQLINNPEANLAIAKAIQAQAAISIERGNIVRDLMSGKIDDAAAWAKFAEIDQRSILTPELKKMIQDVGGNASTLAPLDAGSDPELDSIMNQYPARQ